MWVVPAQSTGAPWLLLDLLLMPLLLLRLRVLLLLVVQRVRVGRGCLLLEGWGLGSH